MSASDLKDALRDKNEVDLTVTGRKSGQERTLTIWFVEEGDRLLLMPIHGTATNWYRNIVKTPEVRLATNGAELQVTARPIEDADAVSEAVGRFGEKYGADRVSEYYPNENAFVEVPLG